MKLLRALLLILLSAVVHAQVNASSELSPCAVSPYPDSSITGIDSHQLSCVAQSVPAAGCALDDVACQCKSKPLSLLIAGCMVNNCTMQESLGKPSISLSQHPNRVGLTET